MSYRLVCISLIAWTLCASDKKLPIEETSNDLIDISATAMLDKEQIKQELGSDFGGDIVLVKVTVRPVSDKPIKVSLDDFLLVSGRDGQRSEPYSPSQIAGSDVLVVTHTEAKKSSGLSLGLGGLGMGGGGSDPGKTDRKSTRLNS